MAELLLWRHGETDFNRAGRIQGRSDIPLNGTGREQAAAAARSLARTRPTRIVSSPLLRARATAEALSGLTGVPVESDEGLIERSFGLWEGLTRAEIESGWPEAFALWSAGADPEGVGIETRSEVAERVAAAIGARLRDAGEGERIVVVAHGAALTLGATRLLGLDPSEWFGLRGLDNCRYGRLLTTGRGPGIMLAGWNLGPASGPDSGAGGSADGAAARGGREADGGAAGAGVVAAGVVALSGAGAGTAEGTAGPGADGEASGLRAFLS